jgi:ketosteroid isomerase-like protein
VEYSLKVKLIQGFFADPTSVTSPPKPVDLLLTGLVTGSYDGRIAVKPTRTGDSQETAMSETYSLPTEPEGIPGALLERFNSGKISALMGLYEPEAVLIKKDGQAVTDRTGIAADLESYQRLGLPLEAKTRHVFVAGDIAEIVLDWSIDGTGPDGEQVHFGGSASDVVRRGADGFWRYLIDNNQGTAVRQPA